MLQKLGYTTAILNSETKQSDRMQMLKDFDVKNRSMDLLPNAGIRYQKLVLIISMPSSVEKLEQTIGRSRGTFPAKRVHGL